MIRSLISTFVASVALLASVAQADDFPSVEVIGNKFYYSNNGSQFLMKGVAYQQNNAGTESTFVDPLADASSCKRDIPYLSAVDTNVIRVYAVNITQDHTECMTALQDAGIYVILDLSEPDTSINRYSPSWDLNLYERYTGVVDAFANYTNVLGFFAGNEVTNAKNNTEASAFVKAAVRDTKKYISDKKYRNIPVGYSSNDDADTRVAIADYFACGSLDDRADFFGINMYEWCGDSTFESSGYKDRTEEYQNLTIPVFFSEYGCNEKRPRKFTEVGALFSNDMTDVWSGGIVYMYFEEENKYGLVSVKGNSVSTLADYSYYSEEIKKISPTLAKASDASKSASNTLSCPAEAATWSASPDLPPTPDNSTCECVYNSLSCIVSDDVAEKDYGDLFGTLCGSDGVDCDVIGGNGTTGKYGGVSFCSNKEKLSYLLNQYYENAGKSKSNCDFDGSATINDKATVAQSCSAKVAAASSDAAATSGGSSSGSDSDASGSGSGSGSKSTSSSTGSKKSSASRVNTSFSTGQILSFTGIITCILGGATFIFV